MDALRPRPTLSAACADLPRGDIHDDAGFLEVETPDDEMLDGQKDSK
jgi:hypothetical protein